MQLLATLLVSGLDDNSTINSAVLSGSWKSQTDYTADHVPCNQGTRHFMLEIKKTAVAEGSCLTQLTAATKRPSVVYGNFCLETPSSGLHVQLR